MCTAYKITKIRAFVIVILFEASCRVITTRYITRNIVSLVMTHQSILVPSSARK